MRILSLILVGFKPLALNNIETIVYTPTSSSQLILGTNGSGKSSLLRETNPLPANKADYRAGGSKKVNVEHLDRTFCLTSDFTKGNKHSFIEFIDGKGTELNLGGTATVQKELVEKIFNYTNAIHQVLTGAIRFTHMSPAARRETLMSISPLELDYATKIFEAARVLSRDSQGAIKHVTNKEADARAKLNSLDYAEGLDVEAKGLEEELNKLIPYATKENHSDVDLLNRIQAALEKIERGAKLFDKFVPEYMPKDDIRCLEDLLSYSGGLRGELNSSKRLMEELTKEEIELDGLVGQVEDGQLSIEDLEARVSHIKSELATISGGVGTQGGFEALKNEIMQVINSTQELLTGRNIRVYPDDEQATNMQSKISIDGTVVNTKLKLDKLKAELDHLREDSSTSICPKCEFKFTASGVDIGEAIAQLEKTIERGDEVLEQAELEKGIIDDLAMEIEEYNTIFGRFLDMRRFHVSNKDFWLEAPSVDEVITSHGSFINYASRWLKAIDIDQARKELTDELTQCNNALDSYKRYGGDMATRLITVQGKIATELDRQQRLEKELTHCTNVENTFTRYQDITNGCEQLLEQLGSDLNSYVDVAITQDAKRRCDDNYAKLGGIQTMLRNKTSLEESVTELGTDLVRLKENKTALDLLVENLSPTKGIIADQMYGFMGSYMDQMNMIMEHLWTYLLEVSVCNMDNGVLDYKFPLHVEGEDVADISKGSEGQQDVIDLAFTLVMRQYLGLTDYPLYLDETGASFDDTHRKLLLNYIKTLIETGQCSQVFMINHYASVHGGLSNHETLVLDDRNITIPSVHNEHVEITFKAA